jgi:hypothetical protein
MARTCPVALYAMAHLFPPSPPSRILDVANVACSECVVDCNDEACMAEIKCVIVPCDNPEHGGDIQCPEESCESTCKVPDNCPLVSSILWNTLTTSNIALQPGNPHAACETLQHRGISCEQDSCSIACESACDDPDNCFLANAVSSRYLKCTPLPH